MAEAPASTAASASSRLVMPQILTIMPTALATRRQDRRISSDARRPGRHDNRHRAERCRRRPRSGCRFRPPRTTPAGIFSASCSEVSRFTSKVCRLRLLTPIKRAPGGDGRLQLFFVMHLHQRRHSIALGQFAEIAHLAFGEDGGDQKNGVGAMGRGLMDMIRVDGEILAQGWKLHGRSRRLQIRQTAQEMFFVGENRQRGRAALLIEARDSRGSNSDARTPLLGDAFLISAMMAVRGLVSAARKSRRWGIERSARASISASRTCRSSFFCSTILARMSGSAFTMGGKLQL